MKTEKINQEYYLSNYREIIPLYVASGAASADTLEHYLIQIKNFLSWCKKSDINPLKLNPSDIRKWTEGLLEKGYARGSVAFMLASVKKFYKCAVILELLKKSPAEEVSCLAPFDEDALITYYTPEDIQQIIHAFDEEKDFIRCRNTLIVYLMGVEGLRNVEIHRMNRNDIDFTNKIIMVRGKEKSGKMEPIYPAKETFEAIDDYLKSIPKDAEIKREEFMVPLILSGSNLHQFGRISRTGLRWIMNEALKRAGMKRKGQSCHILRHSCATNLYADTKDLKKVQAALRHKSSNITARYAKTYDSMNK